MAVFDLMDSFSGPLLETRFCDSPEKRIERTKRPRHNPEDKPADRLRTGKTLKEFYSAET